MQRLVRDVVDGKAGVRGEGRAANAGGEVRDELVGAVGFAGGGVAGEEDELGGRLVVLWELGRVGSYWHTCAMWRDEDERESV